MAMALRAFWNRQKPDLAHLDDPVGQGDVTGSVPNVPSSCVEAHDCLNLEAMLARLLEQLHVRTKVIFLRAVPLADSPPAHNLRLGLFMIE